MRTLTSALVFVSLLAAPAAAQDLKLPTTIYAAAATADLVSTYRNLASGPDAREHNPMLRFTDNRPLPTVLVGTAYAVTSVWAWNRYVGRTHPKWARVGLYVAAGAHVFFAARNTRRFQQAHP